MSDAPDPSHPVDDGPASRWRRARSRFYLGLLVAMMVAIAVAGWFNLARVAR